MVKNGLKKRNFYHMNCHNRQTDQNTKNRTEIIKESVDSLCRIGADAKYKETAYSFTINTLKTYLSIQPSSFRAFMTSKTLRVAKKPRREQLNVKVCCAVAKMPFLLFFFLIQEKRYLYTVTVRTVDGVRLHTVTVSCEYGDPRFWGPRVPKTI